MNTKLFTLTSTALGVLLTLNLAVMLTAGTMTPAAQASDGLVVPPGLNGAAQNTARMIDQLSEIDARLSRIESQLASGISVKVTSLPPGFDKPKEKEPAPAAAPAAAASEEKVVYPTGQNVAPRESLQIVPSTPRPSESK